VGGWLKKLVHVNGGVEARGSRKNEHGARQRPMRRTNPPGKKLSTLPRIESSTVGLDSIEAAADAEHRAAARREMPGGPAWREAAERASAGGSCELALIERGLDDADVIALVASLQREAAGSALTGSRPINNVTSLDLRGNAIGDAGAAALSGLLRGEGCAICTLRLWGNRIGDEGERDTSPAAPNRCMSHRRVTRVWDFRQHTSLPLRLPLLPCALPRL